MADTNRLALVGDIGGTHARFAISDVDEMTIAHFAAFQTRLFPSLQAAIEAYFNSVPHRPDMAGFAVAGPVDGDRIAMTNAPWSFTADEIRAATGASRLRFVNDFEAIALSLPYLNPHDLVPIGGGRAEPDAPKAVLGPGTGLGLCGLVPVPGGWAAVPGEGGHVTFGATDADELAIRKHLAADGGHVSMERVLSGAGLETIHAVLAGLRGGAPERLAAIDIVGRAQDADDTDADARAALDRFAAILARFAGDVALIHGARGGIYLGGGIAPKIVDTLQAGEFRRTFEDKGRLSAWLQDVPVFVVTANDAGLRGAALALSEAFPAEMSP